MIKKVTGPSVPCVPVRRNAGNMAGRTAAARGNLLTLAPRPGHREITTADCNH